MLGLVDLLSAAHVEARSKSMLAKTTWLMWDARNERILQRNVQSPSHLMRKGHRYFIPQHIQNQCLQAQLPCKCCGSPDLLNLSKSTGTVISWSPSHFRSIEINFDAVVLDNKFSIM